MLWSLGNDVPQRMMNGWEGEQRWVVCLSGAPEGFSLNFNPLKQLKIYGQIIHFHIDKWLLLGHYRIRQT
jgi:hypothetical protein